MHRGSWRGRRFGGEATIALLLILSLAGCLPGVPPGPRATPTPRPTPTVTPTATATPLRVAFPTGVPQRPTIAPPPTATLVPAPTPMATPRPTPTATPLPPPELRDAGTLLYIGTLDGRKGIVATAADGRDRRLIAEGNYVEVAWASNGRRFAALAAVGERAVPNRTPDTLDLFDADGRLMRRFDFGSSGRLFTPITWSPDSRHVAISAFGSPLGEATPSNTIATWIMDEANAVRVALAQETWAETWSPAGRLALRAFSPGTPTPSVANRRDSLWLVDASGGDARKLAEGDHRPLGWSPDGATLYALGDLRSVLDLDRGINDIGWLSLVAIESVTGARRVIATADGATPGNATGPSAQWFRQFGAVSSDGGRIAVWAAPLPPERGTPGPRSSVLRVFSADGVLVWTGDVLERAMPPRPSWSPDGRRLAYISASGILRVVAFGPGSTDTRVLGSADPDRGVVQWSPDGRWLAFNRTARGLIIGSSDSIAIEWALDVGGSVPRWQPPRAE